MAVSAITRLLQHPISPDDVHAVLREAAQEAFRRGWTYMEATFQLGQRAEALGLDVELIESEIREIFDAERRRRELDDVEIVESSDRPGPSEQLVQAKSLINKRRSSRFFNIESIEIPWPSEAWRMDLSRLLISSFASEESFQILRPQDSKAVETKVSDVLGQESGLSSLMKKFDGPGAYVRINPSDDGGRYLFRHLLMEVKGLELGRQFAFFRIFNLPCSALVNCGGRTIQAWVRLDGRNREEYEDRSKFVLRILRELGFEVDIHAGNPQASAWLPGTMISGKQCYLLETEAGASSWEEWKSWADAYMDGDPLVESSLSYNEAPQKNIEVVSGLFRQGHRVLFSGPAYCGKTMSAIDLALSISVGELWMGMPTEETAVLFVNVESEASTMVHRLYEVSEARKIDAGNTRLDFLHLLGLNKNPREFVDFLVRRIEAMKKWEQKRYSTLVIDGLVDGLEGRGEEIGSALALLLDRLVVNSGVSVVITARSERIDELAPLVDTVVSFVPTTLSDGGVGIDLQSNGRYLRQKITARLRWDYPIFKKV